MNSPATIDLDAEALYLTLRDKVREWLVARPGAVMVGIWTGGAWLATRLHADLGLPGAVGVISSSLHRDDFGERGMASGTDATKLGFAIEGQHILLIDDVLFTGRTIRATINELYDFGRPASVALAVLVDRGGRQLPIEPTFAAAKVDLPATQRVSLARGEDGRLSFAVKPLEG